MAKDLEQISVRVEPELRARLERRAQEDQRPLAGMIRKILRDATKPANETGVAA